METETFAQKQLYLYEIITKIPKNGIKKYSRQGFKWKMHKMFDKY